MKILKIYGVFGVEKWKAVIPMRRNSILSVVFEGGKPSANIPAKHRTDVLSIQQLIEGSEYFKSGQIRLIRTIEVMDVNEYLRLSGHGKFNK